jgi:predicted RNA binding protein YcfA (HicA-like mRNA interferase family)
MPRLPQVSGSDLVKVFQKDGWSVVGQKGSHIKLRKTLEGQAKQTIIIPQHKVIKKGTLAGILRDSGVSLNRLRDLV